MSKLAAQICQLPKFGVNPPHMFWAAVEHVSASPNMSEPNWSGGNKYDGLSRHGICHGYTDIIRVTYFVFWGKFLLRT